MKLLFLLLIPLFTFGQVNFPTVPQPTQFQNYGNQNFGTPTNRGINIQNIIPDPMQNYNQQQQLQNQQITNQTQQRERQREQQMREIYADINQSKSNINFNLPSLSNKKGTEYYRQVFDEMLTLNVENYSIKDVNFKIENAYFENKLQKEEFDKKIKQIAEFILAKMKELNFDTESNSAKNFMLFKYFTETTQVKGFKEKHFPIKYDFEDYWGRINWSKMFVTKLLKTNTGQCHSMPLLYLTLAEQIGAVAYLSQSPNHSYIKFQDEKGKWYNLELTNGMFTVSSFILNNGFIRSEAIQNNIYMQNMTKKELLSQFYTDLASGYIHKFGYDEFVEKVINKALELNPKSITANMNKANLNTEHLKYAVKLLGIDPTNQQSREKILNYPQAVEILRNMHKQYAVIDDLGFQQMPAEAYEKWLGSLQTTKNKQDNEKEKEQLKRLTKSLNDARTKMDLKNKQ
ncbi:hypothetical protein BWK60_02010 [Flavobacterium covae]|uniref:hypothetical protein n=1 Tax=Flavobacterium covae TaxID=2906076 RepID=UPI000B4C949B|nr:hypothetical protein [Flavobacterium covae]OWP87788.1 hypothetical protein BWK60_02010 [Flavobacterium covae]